MPPLRERKADILLLADHFLEKFSREHGKNIKRISTPAIDMLMSYHWPGNVRELENAIERAVLVCDGQVIHAPSPAADAADRRGVRHRRPRVAATMRSRRSRRTLLQDALKSARGNRAKAARLLAHDRADLQLQGAEVRHRLAAISFVNQVNPISRFMFEEP